MDKTYTRLSNVTLSNFRELLKADVVFNSLSETQQNVAINNAVEKMAVKLNQLGHSDYKFDSIGDASLVLAPTPSSYQNLFDGYLHVKFASYTGDYSAVSSVSGTKVDFDNLVPATDVAVSISGSLVTYVISLGGATVDGDTIIELSSPGVANVVNSTADEITVVASTSHAEFSVFLKNAKET